MRASAAAERAGYPSVSIVASGFLKLAAHVARGLGTQSQAIAEYPGVPMTDSADELSKKMHDSVIPAIVAGLTTKAVRQAEESEPDSEHVVFRGTLEDVQDYFYG